MADEKKERKRNISLLATFYLIVIIWAIFGIQSLFHLHFERFGILPRTKEGLWGIVLAPFLHANLEHITYNTVALFILSFILALLKPRAGIWIWWILAVVTDTLVWIFARGNAVHIGASGVIFAEIGFIVAYGIFRRSIWSILVAILVGAAYGGALWGILPQQPGISWESHLFGLLTGLVVGMLWGRADRRRALLQKLAEQANVD